MFEAADACTTPVLSLQEAIDHPHNVARGTFGEHDGMVLPRPAPHFGRSSRGGFGVEDDAAAVLAAWGIESSDLPQVT